MLGGRPLQLLRHPLARQLPRYLLPDGPRPRHPWTGPEHPAPARTDQLVRPEPRCGAEAGPPRRGGERASAA
eukprot:scaffold1899_cov39-Isochrysis_galbana.AAC.1